ncbi:hypothetical protein [Motilimonas eburnea]|uniref:hypothetical protein n=1 Tax=Motilimonas eburnea TaxID=1737488 RepID=UPI001E355852|nr:hypothetical protein [Motilimonas eburnea]MCE2570273.1 hypothetical protein [Motilimonas eburnea]
MSSYVLCIFEGKKAEPNITHSLCNCILNSEDKVILRASYGFNIYKLYAELKKDPYLDTYELIAEELKKRRVAENRQGKELNEDELAVINIDDSTLISDIYLIFDYDAHCTNANDEKLTEMLEKFSDAQDEGLLLVSYPMVEAIKHQQGAKYQEEVYPISGFANYKSWTNTYSLLDKRYQNWGAYDFDIWKEIIEHHLARANYLLNEQLSLPVSQLESRDIFMQQLEKHIPDGNVAVVSSFPLMLFDFYGDRLQSRLIQRSSVKSYD